MKGYYTKITAEDMIAAKTNDEVLMNIMNRLAPYINYISDIMYRNYGGEYDGASSREDLNSFCSINIATSIRKYYHPEKYNKRKDKKGNEYYKDGFSFVCQVSKRLLKYWWRYHRRQKRIPPEIIISLDSPINPDEGQTITVGDMISHTSVDAMKNPRISEKILTYFKKHNKKIGKIYTYTLATHIIKDNWSPSEISTYYKISKPKVEKIIKEKFVDKLKSIKL